ncbi:g10154 [Coccomyxa viridis]|uniref:G10154 protein n=1 Tax=Coccomyxa viridis TaxID=1274662 RepID=A0ABP1G780_9CHLO
MITAEELYHEAEAKSAAADALIKAAHTLEENGRHWAPRVKMLQAADLLEEARTLRERALTCGGQDRGASGVVSGAAAPSFYRSLQHVLPTPSECANIPSQIQRVREGMDGCGGHMLDHRPIEYRGVPLEVLCKAFAECSDLMHTVEPMPADCKAAGAMAQVTSQVGRDATAQLQQDMHNIFEAWLGHRIVLTQPGPGESGPSISGSVGGHVVLLVKVMTDQGGDARAELLHCYLDHLATQERIDGLLQRSCMPVLSVEIKGGILSVGGFAADEHTLLSEPLRQPVQLYLSNFPQHMLAVAQALAAIRLTLDSLAAEQQHAADTRSSPPELWAGRPWLLCQGQFESWQVQKLWGDTIYLLEPPQTAAGSQSPGTSAAGAQVQPSQLVAKFWQPQGDHALGDLVQAAWHEQGVAPEVVATFPAGSWRLTVMRYLALEEGWAPLLWLAPSSHKLRASLIADMEADGGDPSTVVPADETEWRALQIEALRALGKGHRAQVKLPAGMEPVDGEEVRSVHADARLINTVARRGPGGWEVQFVDFAWSGIQKLSRYPVLMNPEMPWPEGAQPRAHLIQHHDEDLLLMELRSG